MNNRQWREIGGAMAAQLDRVNEGEDYPRAAFTGAKPYVPPPSNFGANRVPTREENALTQKLERLQEQVQALQNELATAHTTIHQLRAAHADKSTVWRNGHPCLTPAQAARKSGLSVSQVSRYCNTKWWQGERDETGHWYIYADQDLVPKERGKKRKK